MEVGWWAASYQPVVVVWVTEPGRPTFRADFFSFTSDVEFGYQAPWGAARRRNYPLCGLIPATRWVFGPMPPTRCSGSQSDEQWQRPFMVRSSTWRDHISDPALRDCSLASKGFWIGILALMHEGTPVGHLTIGGKAATPKQMAFNVNCTVRQAEKCLAELEAACVFSRTDDGTIYSCRMVKDAEAAETAKAWGKAGGNPNLKPKPNGASHGPTEPGGVNPPVNTQGYPPPNPTPLTLPLTEGVKGGVIPRGRVKKETEEEERASNLSNLPYLPTGTRASCGGLRNASCWHVRRRTGAGNRRAG